MKYNGTYSRSIKCEGEIVHLEIQVAKCKCGKTHAVIIDAIVKNCIISKKDQKYIIELYKQNMTYKKIAEEVNIEIYNVADIIKRYKNRHNF